MEMGVTPPALPHAALNILLSRKQPGRRRDACEALARRLAGGLALTDDLRLA